MLQTYEAVLQANGQLVFIEPPMRSLQGEQRVLVTFTQEAGADTALCSAVLSEAVLAQDWLNDEEDAAWAHLQAAK